MHERGRVEPVFKPQELPVARMMVQVGECTWGRSPRVHAARPMLSPPRRCSCLITAAARLSGPCPWALMSGRRQWPLVFEGARRALAPHRRPLQHVTGAAQGLLVAPLTEQFRTSFLSTLDWQATPPLVTSLRSVAPLAMLKTGSLCSSLNHYIITRVSASLQAKLASSTRGASPGPERDQGAGGCGQSRAS